MTFIIGGKANVMLATRAVRAGQELCISYGPTFAFTARGGRLTEVSCCWLGQMCENPPKIRLKKLVKFDWLYLYSTTIWQILCMLRRETVAMWICQKKKSWNHIGWTYFRRVLVNWNQSSVTAAACNILLVFALVAMAQYIAYNITLGGCRSNLCLHDVLLFMFLSFRLGQHNYSLDAFHHFCVHT